MGKTTYRFLQVGAMKMFSYESRICIYSSSASVKMRRLLQLIKRLFPQTREGAQEEKRGEWRDPVYFGRKIKETPRSN